MSDKSDPFQPFSMQPGGLEGPAWRAKRAQRLADAEQAQRLTEGPAELDDLTARAAEYFQSVRRGPAGAEAAAARDPLVDAAIRLWEDEDFRQQLQILVIADVSPLEIAGRLALGLQLVLTTEALYFDLRGRLDAAGWVSCQVIRPLVRSGAADLAAKLKLAYYGGPDAARAILDARIGVPSGEAERQFDLQLLLDLKLEEALELPLEGGQQLEFLKVCLKHDLDQKRLQLDRLKFVFQYWQAAAAEESQGRAAQTAADDPREQSGQPKKADQRRDVGQDLRVLGEDRSSHAAA